MLSHIKHLFSTTNILLLANDTSVVLYESNQGRLDPKLTIDYTEITEKLIKYLKKYHKPNVTVVLDPQGETQKAISIPDIGSMKTKDALKKKLQNMPGDILCPIIAHKPTKKSHNWKFIIVTSNLIPSIHELISTLIQHNIFMTRVHLLSSGMMAMSKNIQKLIRKKIISKNNSYFFIYMQNTNGEVCEFTLKDHHLINYKSENVDDSELLTQIQKKFTKNKNRLKFQKVPENQVYLILLLPEQFRSSVIPEKNTFFLSARDAGSEILKRTTSGVCSYSNILNEIAFIRNIPRKISIPAIQKLTALKNIHRFSVLPIYITLLTLIFISANYCFLIYKEKINIKNQLNYYRETEENLSNIKILSKKKHKLLERNAELNNIYNMINNNPYSIDMMTGISTANTKLLPVDSFSYSVPNITKNKCEITLKINSSSLYEKRKSNYFVEVDNFVKTLESKFPSKEISVSRENSNNDEIIIIKLSDIEE